MPGSLITESYRKRRAPDGHEGDSAAAKRSKTTESATAADSYASASITKQHETAYSTADSKGQQSQAEQLADQHPSEHSPRKENRSPNYEPALSYMEQQFGLPDNLACPEQQSIEHDQVTSDISEHLQAQAADGFLNLLLLAHSSLDDTNTALGQQESRPGHCQAAEDALTQSATDSSACDDQNQQRSAQASEADPKHEHQTVAGLRPSAIASAASLTAIDFDSDSDSSSEDEPEPTPSKPRKVEGCGRYGQELNNIAGMALKQTTLLKKKCANRTAKTKRQLKCAPDHSCGAAHRAVEASRLAEEKVQNLARFADAFDDLVKQAVQAANAAAQERADYFASVAAAEMAAAVRGRVASKRDKRRASSPKQSKSLSWASAEHLVQRRVFSKTDSPLASKNQESSISQ